MRNFFIAYDLAAPETNLDKLVEEILVVGRAAELVRSVWYVKSPLDEKAIRDHLRPLLNPKDQLLIIAATNANGFGLDPGLWEAVKAEWAREEPKAR